jgi:hypothetical protein
MERGGSPVGKKLEMLKAAATQVMYLTNVSLIKHIKDLMSFPLVSCNQKIVNSAIKTANSFVSPVLLPFLETWRFTFVGRTHGNEEDFFWSW